jgi:hypothetical protein
MRVLWYGYLFYLLYVRLHYGYGYGYGYGSCWRRWRLVV